MKISFGQLNTLKRITTIIDDIKINDDFTEDVNNDLKKDD